MTPPHDPLALCEEILAAIDADPAARAPHVRLVNTAPALLRALARELRSRREDEEPFEEGRTSEIRLKPIAMSEAESLEKPARRGVA